MTKCIVDISYGSSGRFDGDMGDLIGNVDFTSSQQLMLKSPKNWEHRIRLGRGSSINGSPEWMVVWKVLFRMDDLGVTPISGIHIYIYMYIYNYIYIPARIYKLFVSHASHP